MASRYLVLVAVVIAAAAANSSISAAERSPASKPAPVDFGREIKPLLTEHCLKCHGPDKAEGGLNLADRTAALKELESGSHAIVPGHPTEGELLARVTSDDPSVRMPPGEEKPLKLQEIDVLRRWIAEGAEYQTHWAFRTLTKPKPPRVQDRNWARNPIDALVLAKLEERGIRPSPEAEPHLLIKRLYLDLTGLLPTPAEVTQFVGAYSSAESNKDGVYAALVDHLLASPHFGERWGRHWLDMARYADSDGYEKDRARPDAYVFRDWVIDAFNTDKPFDEFTIEQLAGDLLPAASFRQKLATAFNRQTLTNTEGGTDQEEYRVAAVFDRTDTLGTVWLGLTVGCAKCHTHKYDPITHAEYYRLFAFFNGADEVAETLPVKAKNLDELEAQLQPLEAAIEARYRELAPSEQKWEDEQRKVVESTPNSKLRVEKGDVAEVRAASKARFTPQKDGSWLVDAKANAAKVDTYTVTFATVPAEVTGVRIDVLPDESTESKWVGRGSKGNFVVTHLSAAVVDPQGKPLREVPLQRATVDYEQRGYKADDVLLSTPNTKRGWAVAGKPGEAHYLQVRTMEPLKLKKTERLQLSIEQNYGNRHTIARLKLSPLTGNARELHLPDEIVKILNMYPEKRVNENRDKLFEFYANQDPRVKQLRAKIAAVNKQYASQLMRVRMIATSRKGRKTYRFDRGDFLSPAEQVQPGTLGVLPELGVDGKQATRLDLARWLVGPRNPLTARVLANQVWSKLFGLGLVRSISDFGVRGDLPSHPELLDWLAVTYRDELKWGTKAFLKTILMSSAYRQSSAHRAELVETDPLNTLLYRQNRIRVEAELVRDLALEVGGLLSPKIGGPSVYPPMPADLAKLSYANNFSWTESTGDDRYRRGMYTFFKRTIPHPTLMTFDCPDANTTCVNRSISNTPLQALALLNNDAFVESSQSLAQRLLGGDARGDADRIAAAVRACLVREPEADEVDRLDNLLEQARRYYHGHPDEAEALVGSHRLPTVASDETAAWIVTVRVLLNLDEFITRE